MNVYVQYLGDAGDAGDVGEYFGDAGDICAGATEMARVSFVRFIQDKRSMRILTS